MAIVKFNNRKNSTANFKRNKLRRAITYIIDKKKTSNDLIGGIGVNGDNAYERMQVVKQFYGKLGGREYIHFVVSFKGKKDADIAYLIAEQIAALYDGFQVLFAVHLNTQNTHIHFVINSVNINDGHKFSQSRSDLQRLKCDINEISDKFGLNSEEIIVDENEYFDFEDESYCNYDSDSWELIEPMIFDNTDGLIRPIIFMYEDEYYQQD